MANSRETPLPCRVSRRDRGGFTLVELLVVIGVIALLIGILLPVLGRARTKSTEVVCQANLREIGVASRMYANDFDDRFPDKYTLGGTLFRGGAGWKNEDDPFSREEIYGMPALYAQLGYVESSEGEHSIWICPAQSPEMQSWRNTYAWSNGTITNRTSLFRGNEDNLNVWWVWDNYSFKPFTPGARRGRGDPLSVIPTDQRIYPHEFQQQFDRTATGRAEGSINILFLDGAVGGAVFKVRGDDTNPSYETFRG